MKEQTIEMKKMTLKGYYNSLTEEEKKIFRDRIIAETMKSFPTVYTWLRGANKPGYLDQVKVTDISNGIVIWE